MAEPEDMDDIPAPVKKPEEECDPLTMNCAEMPKMMETLMRKESILTDGIEKIKDLQKTFPSRKELTDLHDDAIRAKEKIHGTISDITTRFSMCTLKEEKRVQEPEAPEEQTGTESETPV